MLFARFSLFLNVASALLVIPEAFQSAIIRTNNTNVKGSAVALDPTGDIYIAGSSSLNAADFHGIMSSAVRLRKVDANLKFSEDAVRTKLVSSNDASHGLFVAKLSPPGDIKWVRNFGSSSQDFVTSAVSYSDAIYVAGGSYGVLDGIPKESPEGTSDLFVVAYNSDGTTAWDRPLQVGSAGSDRIQDMSIDQDLLNTKGANYMYACGCAGGHLFRSPRMASAQGASYPRRGKNKASTAQRQTVSRLSMPPTSLRQRNDIQGDPRLTVSTGSALESRVEASAPLISRLSEYFVAKIDLRTGEIVDAVQMHLRRNSSADAIVARSGLVYVAVNSYGVSTTRESPDTALYVFDPSTLDYSVVKTQGYDVPGISIKSADVDSSGNVYLAGCVSSSDYPSQGDYVVRKYNPRMTEYEWERRFGIRAVTDPSISIAVGMQSGIIFVAGYNDGAFMELKNLQENGSSTTLASNASDSGLTWTGVTLLLPDGREYMTWHKPSRYPDGFETMTSVYLDGQENVIFTGSRLNASSDISSLILGSLGSWLVVERAYSPEGQSEKHLASKTLYYNVKGQGMDRLLIALACITVTIVFSFILFALFFVHSAKSKTLRSRAREDKLKYRDDAHMEDNGHHCANSVPCFAQNSAQSWEFYSVAHDPHFQEAASQEIGDSAPSSRKTGGDGISRSNTAALSVAPGGSSQPM